MKFFFIIILIIFKFEIAFATEKIAFIDLNYIMNNSVAGKSINNFIDDLSKQKKDEFNIIENQLKEDENDLLSKKNIIDKNVYNKKVDELKLRINNYKLERQKFNKNLSESKFKYNNQLLEKLNPIISDYVEKNLITIVLPKKMIIVGKKKLDITQQILLILDNSIQKVNFNE